MAGSVIRSRSLNTSSLYRRPTSPIPCAESVYSKAIFQATHAFTLGLGYSAPPALTIEDRLKIGGNIEAILSTDHDAAKAPPRDTL